MCTAPIALVLAAAVALAGCGALTCTPTTIMVAEKEERTRLMSESRGLRTDPMGRVYEDRREVPVPDYWVKDETNQWYRIGPTEFRTAEVGKPAQVCK